jgi:hypothetical protein
MKRLFGLKPELPKDRRALEAEIRHVRTLRTTGRKPGTLLLSMPFPHKIQEERMAAQQHPSHLISNGTKGNEDGKNGAVKRVNQNGMF